MKPTISLNEMRERVADLLYGNDWIGELTDEEYELLRKYLTPRQIVRADGSTIRLDHIEQCPTITLAAKLDRALGRQARMGAQYVTVDTWIQDHRLPVQGAERKTFNAILRKARKELAPKVEQKRRGPKANIFDRLTGEMKDDISNKRLSCDELAAMPDKELQEKYKAKRERVRAARQSVVDERRKKLPTNADKK